MPSLTPQSSFRILRGPFMSQPIHIIVAITLLVFIGSKQTCGADQKSEEDTQPVDIVDPIQKGTVEIAVLAGLGSSHAMWDGVDGTSLLVLGGRMGKVLSGPRGPGVLRGNLEVSGELLPVFLVDEGKTTAGFSMTLLARHFLLPGSRWRPFISLGAGPLFTADPIPDGISRVNFTPQMGLGVAYSHSQHYVFYAEYRLHHISNASTGDENPGINSSYLQFGMSLHRW